MVFVATGAVGIIWAVIWYAVYREPRDFKGANEAEIELIREGGGLVDIQAEASQGQSQIQLDRSRHRADASASCGASTSASSA